MGMDVSGNPSVLIGTSPEPPDQEAEREEWDAYWEAKNEYYDNNPGVYFRANVWSWRPIMEAMEESGAYRVLPIEQWEHMHYNDGAGARTKEQCKEMASRLRSWLEGLEGDEYTPESLDQPDMQVDAETGSFVGEAESIFRKTRSPYSTTKEHLESWVKFLENCGDRFEVW